MNDGRALESAVANHFAAHGYDVQLNAILEGRTGARHEVDVLATRVDALTTVRVAIECKAWQQPVEKDVVSKLHYVLGDLGLNKGVIVSTGGFRSGADRAAAELSIDLWGPDEVAARLGHDAVAALTGAHPTVREAVGWPFRSGLDVATRHARGAARGSVLLRRQEQVLDVRPAWLPVHVALLSVTEVGRRWGRSTLASRVVANRYEAISGRFLGPASTSPQPIDLGDVVAITALAKSAKLAPTLDKAFEQAQRVTTDAARARHAAKLEALGVPVPCHSVSVDRVELMHWPVWVALLDQRDTQRLVVVDGTTGRLDEQLSAILTTHLTHVRTCLR